MFFEDDPEQLEPFRVVKSKSSFAHTMTVFFIRRLNKLRCCAGDPQDLTEIDG